MSFGYAVPGITACTSRLLASVQPAWIKAAPPPLRDLIHVQDLAVANQGSLTAETMRHHLGRPWKLMKPYPDSRGVFCDGSCPSPLRPDALLHQLPATLTTYGLAVNGLLKQLTNTFAEAAMSYTAKKLSRWKSSVTLLHCPPSRHHVNMVCL